MFISPRERQSTLGTLEPHLPKDRIVLQDDNNTSSESHKLFKKYQEEEQRIFASKEVQ